MRNSRGHLDSAFGPEEYGPDLRVLVVRGVRRSLRWIVGLSILGATVGLVAGVLEPNLYESHAKLLLRVGAREAMSSESLAGIDNPQHSTRPTVADELQMLSDVAVFERVVHKLGAREILSPADPRSADGPLTPAPVRWMHALQARLFAWTADEEQLQDPELALRVATKALMENTRVTNEPGTNVIVVSHTTTSPEKARAITEALASAFIERHRDQFSTQPLVDKNRGKLADFKAERDAAADAYFAHLDQCSFVDLVVQGPALLTEIETLDRELFGARLRREEIARQRSSIVERMKGAPTDIEVVRPAVLVPNEEYETLLALKRTLLAQRTNLAFENRPLDEARRLKEQYDEQITRVEEELRTTPKAVTQSTEQRESVGPSALKVQVGDLEVEDAALVVKVELLRARLDEKHALAKELRRCEKTHADLASVRAAEDSRYRHLVERFSVLEALGSMDVQEDANLRWLQTATLDREKVGPKRAGLLLKGLVAGLLIGLTFAVLRQRFDTTLADPLEFERDSGVPVLGVVPDHAPLRAANGTAIAGSG